MGSVTMTRPLSRALRRHNAICSTNGVHIRNNDSPAFQGIETRSYLSCPEGTILQ